MVVVCVVGIFGDFDVFGVEDFVCGGVGVVYVVDEYVVLCVVVVDEWMVVEWVVVFVGVECDVGYGV